MTTMTTTLTLPGGQDPEHYAGRADAYDEHTAGATLTELLVRAAYILDLHPSDAYGRGYSAYVTGARLEQDADAAIETARAFRKADAR